MTAFPFLRAPCVYVEIGHSSLKMLDGEDGLELSLERAESGRLTSLCAERLTDSLRVFLRKHKWRPRLRAFCAIGARGVSLRRLKLPPASKEELQRLLPLQIEREFPLAPEELAWGYCPIDPEKSPRHAAQTAPQEFLVVAVKREVLQEYAEVLAGCGLNPVFTLGALARSSLCPHPPDSYAVLDIGRSQSELICFDGGLPVTLRVMPWGGEDCTRAIESKLGIGHAEAEKRKLQLEEDAGSAAPHRDQVQSALDMEFESLARSLRKNWTGQKLYLAGASTRLRELAPRLAQAIGPGVSCERLEVAPGEGRSAAIQGLRAGARQNGAGPPLVLHLKPATDRGSNGRLAAPWKWAALAGLLAILLLSLRYLEAAFQQSRLASKLAELRSYRENLPNLERELGFLQYLKTNQPPHLDAIFALASAAPSGLRLETLSLGRRGELSLRASLRDSQQVVDFRSKLIDSGLFATVVVEEQTPSPDRQKMTVRITGQSRYPMASQAPASAPTVQQPQNPAKEPGPPAEEKTAPAAPGASRTNAAPKHAKEPG